MSVSSNEAAPVVSERGICCKVEHELQARKAPARGSVGSWEEIVAQAILQRGRQGWVRLVSQTFLHNIQLSLCRVPLCPAEGQRRRWRQVVRVPRRHRTEAGILN